MNEKESAAYAASLQPIARIPDQFRELATAAEQEQEFSRRDCWLDAARKVERALAAAPAQPAAPTAGKPEAGELAADMLRDCVNIFGLARSEGHHIGGTYTDEAMLAEADRLAALHPAPASGGEAVREAAQALVDKLAVIHADPQFFNVWLHAHNHGRPYTGPTYESELQALTAALAPQRSERGE